MGQTWAELGQIQRDFEQAADSFGIASASRRYKIRTNLGRKLPGRGCSTPAQNSRAPQAARANHGVLQGGGRRSFAMRMGTTMGCAFVRCSVCARREIFA